MALQSDLFRGDKKLEDAATEDAAHIQRGAKGDHVAKIQQALNILDNAGLTVDGDYGRGTASAVLAYKTRRSIINPAYQTQADDIVGKMTVATMDRELVQRASGPVRIVPVAPQPLFRPVSHPRQLVGFAIGDAGAPKALSFNVTEARIEPRNHLLVTILNADGGSADSVDQTRAGSNKANSVLIYSLFPNLRNMPFPFGTHVDILGNTYFLMVHGYRPGDAVITASSGGKSDTLKIFVRAPKLGVTPGIGPKIADPRSKGFVTDKNSEANPTGVNAGRPINPLQGEGRNINVGGEGETPGFEDYSANLPFSGYNRPWTGDADVFRPLITDPVAGVSKGGATNICMRGTPFTDQEIDDIIVIAAGRCRLTFNGSVGFADKFKAKFGGRELVRFDDGGPTFVSMVLERP